LISYDFDSEVQGIFDKKFSEISLTNWKRWLDITSKEEYEELSLNLSGLCSIEDKQIVT